MHGTADAHWSSAAMRALPRDIFGGLAEQYASMTRPQQSLASGAPNRYLGRRDVSTSDSSELTDPAGRLWSTSSGLPRSSHCKECRVTQNSTTQHSTSESVRDCNTFRAESGNRRVHVALAESAQQAQRA